MRLPMVPLSPRANIDLSVTAWHSAQLTPTNSPLGTMPITALAFTSATSVAGSLSLGALAGEWSPFNSWTRVALRSAGTMSASILTPAFRASSKVSLAAFMPWGIRTAVVQKPSSPNVSCRNTSRPASTLPAMTVAVESLAVVWAVSSVVVLVLLWHMARVSTVRADRPKAGCRQLIEVIMSTWIERVGIRPITASPSVI